MQRNDFTKSIGTDKSTVIKLKAGRPSECPESAPTNLYVSEKFTDKIFFRRLNTISHAADAVANDVFSHNLHVVKVKREAEPYVKPTELFLAQNIRKYILRNCY